MMLDHESRAWTRVTPLIAAILLVASFAMAIGGGCCASAEAKRVVELNEAAATGMVREIDAGHTTRDQEQKYIRAQAAAWTAIREALK